MDSKIENVQKKTAKEVYDEFTQCVYDLAWRTIDMHNNLCTNGQREEFQTLLEKEPELKKVWESLSNIEF